MRTRSVILLALLVLTIGPARGQGFPESLFGSDTLSRSSPASGYVRLQPAAKLSPYAHFSSPVGQPFNPYLDEPPQPHERSTTYRTLCVRMCDGFYFPVSNATSSAGFSHDAEKCAASCGREARLFYYPNSGGSVEGMLDMTGRAYASYPIAFRYRKTLVQGCQCRPQPWTEAERERHRAYAMAHPPDTPDTANTVRGDALHAILGQVTPGAEPPGGAAHDDLRAVARPEPVYREAGQWNWSPDLSSAGQARSLYRWPGGR
jgi:hypothetical protein